MEEFEEQMMLNEKTNPKELNYWFEDVHKKFGEFQDFCEHMSQLEATLCGERTENSCTINEEFPTLIHSMNDLTIGIFDVINKASEYGNVELENDSELTTILKATTDVNELGIEADNCLDTLMLLKKIGYGIKHLVSDKENCSPNAGSSSESASRLSSSDFSFLELNNRGATSSPFKSRLDDNIKTPVKK